MNIMLRSRQPFAEREAERSHGTVMPSHGLDHLGGGFFQSEDVEFLELDEESGDVLVYPDPHGRVALDPQTGDLELRLWVV